MKAISHVLERGKPLNKAKKALILLHGRGGSAESILTLVDSFKLDDFHIIAPQAVNHTWYPYSFMEKEILNEPYLSSTIDDIHHLIEQIALHIPYENIFLAGFSQGACLSLEISSRFARKYGGIIAFTGALMGQNLDLTRYQGNFEQTKVFMSNGDDDPFIPLARSRESKIVMENRGAQVTLKVYEGRPHTVTQDELDILKNFILS